MNLRSYIEDKDVKEALSGYGKFKSKIIRLKYKSDHDLAGLVNGKRSVKRVLEKKSIPYSLRIAGNGEGSYTTTNSPSVVNDKK